METLQLTIFDKNGSIVKHILIPNPSIKEKHKVMRSIFAEGLIDQDLEVDHYVDLSDGGLVIYRLLKS